MKPVPHGEPYAGNLHVRFDEGADVPDEGRLALLYQLNAEFRVNERITFVYFWKSHGRAPTQQKFHLPMLIGAKMI